MIGNSFSRRTLLGTLGSAGLAPAAIPTLEQIKADERKKWKGSQLGSLYPFIQQELQRTRQSMAFQHVPVTKLESWRAAGRAKVFELLLYRPASCPAQAKILERTDEGDYWRERVSFQTAPGIHVPAYVLLPKHGKFPAPAVLALHDHGGFYYWGKEHIVQTENEHPELRKFRESAYDGLSFPITLARHGYVVIVIDMFYFGERRLVLDVEPEDRSTAGIWSVNKRNQQLEGLVLKDILYAGFTWAGVVLWDDIRTIDYLQTRPEVDPNRIACAGLSIGGYRAAFLAGLDSRIKAACVAGWMTSIRFHFPRFESSLPANVVPGLIDFLDYPDVASLGMPLPLLVVAGRHDPLFPPKGVHAACEELADCYKRIGKPEHFQGMFFDGGHRFPTDAQERMLDWFARWV